jgi:hypothetical protein
MKNFFIEQENSQYGLPDATIPCKLLPSYGQSYEDVIIEGILGVFLVKKIKSI